MRNETSRQESSFLNRETRIGGTQNYTLKHCTVDCGLASEWRLAEIRKKGGGGGGCVRENKFADLINRPVVAGAVLQTPSSLIH